MKGNFYRWQRPLNIFRSDFKELILRRSSDSISNITSIQNPIHNFYDGLFPAES